jgi:hypothetical protein
MGALGVVVRFPRISIAACQPRRIPRRRGSESDHPALHRVVLLRGVGFGKVLAIYLYRGGLFGNLRIRSRILFHRTA